MRISTKGRYALQVMLYLANHDSGTFIPLKAISQNQGITVKYLEQIIPPLNRAGYLHSAGAITAVTGWPAGRRSM